jgi:hypothetical protein
MLRGNLPSKRAFEGRGDQHGPAADGRAILDLFGIIVNVASWSSPTRGPPWADPTRAILRSSESSDERIVGQICTALYLRG